MKKKKISIFVKILVIVAVLLFVSGIVSFLKPSSSVSRTTQDSILALELKGILLEKQKFIKDLRKYSQDEKIKGVLIRLDSPGGAVALSEELYQEFKRVREILQKPVVISAGSTMASGALYAAVGASFIIVNSGTLVGSIGVIWPLMNMERLYEWAKVEPYSIKTGEFKDSGTKFRPLTSKERILFQDLLNELLDQFKSAIIEGRKMRPEDLVSYTDGRVFTGDFAVSVGFADAIGTYSDAIERIGELSGLGKKPKLFTPQPNYFELLSHRLSSIFNGEMRISSFLEEKTALLSILGIQSSGKPMYIFPPAIGL